MHRHQMHRLVVQIIRYNIRTTAQSSTAVINFDITKAFDKVWRNDLFFKLLQCLVNTLEGFLLNKYVQYRVKGPFSFRFVGVDVP